MTEDFLSSSTNKYEVDIIAVARSIWCDRIVVLKSILFFGLFGIVIAISTPNEYVASTIMVPTLNDNSSKLGGLGGLAAIAGININSGSGNDLSPTVYPQIVKCLPFQLELMKTRMNFSDRSTPITFYEYYSEPRKENFIIKYTLGLPRILFNIPRLFFSAFRSKELKEIGISEQNSPLELTDKERDVRSALSEFISLNVNTKEGILTLTSRMPEAKAAAQLGLRAQELLQQFIIEFKIKKAKANLEFIQQRYDETVIKFEYAQKKLASFRDRNKSITLATVKSEEELLTSQFNLIYSVYLELAKQLEQAKIQVKQETPVFSIIEPITVPTNKSKPNRSLIIFIWVLIGGIFGIAFIFGKHFTNSIKLKLKIK